jgi:molecular chaperone GrpE
MDLKFSRNSPLGGAGDEAEDPDGPVPPEEALIPDLSPQTQQIANLEAHLAEEREHTLRAVADLQNFRRRAAEERSQQALYANQELVAELLPILDNFERATECQVEGPAAESLYTGVCMILTQLREVLTRFGVERMVTEGEFFDPARHEAVARVETREACEGTIVGEAQSGYTLNGKVVRAAQVAVAVEPPS